MAGKGSVTGRVTALRATDNSTSSNARGVVNDIHNYYGFQNGLQSRKEVLA